MTNFNLSMRASQHAELLTHLLPESGFEQAAYLLCRVVAIHEDPWLRQQRTTYLVTDIVPIPPEEVTERSSTRITWRTNSFARALKQAEKEGKTVAIIHSHRSSSTAFSKQDDDNEPDLIQMALNRNGPGTRLLSLVMNESGDLGGRVWRQPMMTGCDIIASIKITGARVRFFRTDAAQNASRSTHQRQALAFGPALNRDLRALRIGVVGAGGTGSAVAMLLARLGVGKIALFDGDIVDETNLNRLHGATQTDADSMRFKVDVVARSIAEMGLGVKVVPVRGWIGGEESRDALRSCEVVFGCTDDHDGRLILNRLAYYYLIPVIDIGLAIEPAAEDHRGLLALDARVTVIEPEETCLICRSVANPRTASVESLRRSNPQEYERRKAEAYVEGEGNPSPAVVTFTTEAACMAINELIHRMQGFRGPGGAAANRVRKFHLGEDRRPGHKPKSGCSLCATDKLWGQGDTEPFLGRIG